MTTQVTAPSKDYALMAYPGFYAEEKVVSSDYEIKFVHDHETNKKSITIKFINGYQISLNQINLKIFLIPEDKTKYSLTTLDHNMKELVEKILGKSTLSVNSNLVWQISLDDSKTFDRRTTIETYFNISYSCNQGPNPNLVLDRGLIVDHKLVHDYQRKCAHHLDDFKIAYTADMFLQIFLAILDTASQNNMPINSKIVTD